MNGGTLCLRTSSWENTLEEVFHVYSKFDRGTNVHLD
jgi:hypothetical protein